MIFSSKTPVVFRQQRPLQQVLQVQTRQEVLQVQTRQQEVQTRQQEEVQTRPKPIRWGEPTWFLFHTLAEKIKPERFALLRTELLSLISNICQNLPCPDCANHATEFLAQNRFMYIASKEQLVRFLFEFHNSVNRKKGFPLFQWTEMDKYKSAILVNILAHFFQQFAASSGNARMMHQAMFRQRLLSSTKQWLMNHLDAFDP
jgi:hypothetical protein